MKRLSKRALNAELSRLIAVLPRYAPQKVWLFGSYARGDYHAGSDVDLLVIKETEHAFVERVAEFWRACESNLSVEPVIYTRAEFERLRAENNPFIAQVLSEGRIIYEQQPE